MPDLGDEDSDVLLSRNRRSWESPPENTLSRMDSKSGRSVCSTPKLMVLMGTAILAISAMLYLDSNRVEIIVAWLKQNRQDGAFLFVVLGAVAIILLFPGTIISLCAGAVYGTATGSVLVWFTNLLGQTAAFMVGRYVLRDFVVHHAIKKIPNFRVIDGAISKNGWKMILLLRISPVVPFNLLNYGLATTGISLTEFTLASAIGVIPWILVLVHMGDVARAAMGKASQGFAGLDELGWGPWTTFTWVFFTVASIVGLGWYTRYAIGKALEAAAQENAAIEERDLEQHGIDSGQVW